MRKGRFLSLVITEHRKYHEREFEKFLKPISRIQDDILSEASKGKVSLEINRRLDEPICTFLREEGFIIHHNINQHNSHPEMTTIVWAEWATNTRNKQ